MHNSNPRIKPNTFAYLNPTSWDFEQFFKRLFSWQSMSVLLLLDKAVTMNLKKKLKINKRTPMFIPESRVLPILMRNREMFTFELFAVTYIHEIREFIRPMMYHDTG